MPESTFTAAPSTTFVVTTSDTPQLLVPHHRKQLPEHVRKIVFVIEIPRACLPPQWSTMWLAISRHGSPSPLLTPAPAHAESFSPVHSSNRFYTGSEFQQKLRTENRTAPG
ncbi:hypothetical protein F5887DRAFT_916726 [Amanita rubescens]|nr:hypothetical protein F5887DRAFT_916726 [Amanita rubescens]